jgi:hypothetical protein
MSSLDNTVSETLGSPWVSCERIVVASKYKPGKRWLLWSSSRARQDDEAMKPEGEGLFMHPADSHRWAECWESFTHAH